MQKDRIKYVILICVLLSALVVVRHYARKPVDWKITFDYRHKAPYGCFVMNDLFHALFSDSIVYNNESVYDNDLIKKAAGRNLVIITGQFDPDDAESGSLFDFVGKGNTAFISAQDIPDDFLDTLGLSVRSGTMDQPLFKQANVRLNFYNPVLKKDSGYVFRPVMMPSYFNVKKSFQGKLLGYDSLGRVNYVACRWEKGTFLIHTRPLVFTNLQLLYGDPDYASAALSYLPDQPLIIDRYFKPYRMINRSPTRFILSEAPLRAAFYLILFVRANLDEKAINHEIEARKIAPDTGFGNGYGYGPMMGGYGMGYGRGGYGMGYGMGRYGMMGYGMGRYGMGRYGMGRYGMGGYGMGYGPGNTLELNP